MNEQSRKLDYEWHRLINAAADKLGHGEMSFMYEAKSAWEELQRLPLLFARERTGLLTKLHRQCSLSPLQEVPDNHLTCCKGVECRKCPFLLALNESAEMTSEERDVAKAWTCISHIIGTGGDVAREGYIMTVDDRMYWDNVYKSMAMEMDEGTL